MIRLQLASYNREVERASLTEAVRRFNEMVDLQSAQHARCQEEWDDERLNMSDSLAKLNDAIEMQNVQHSRSFELWNEEKRGLVGEIQRASEREEELYRQTKQLQKVG